MKIYDVVYTNPRLCNGGGGLVNMECNNWVVSART